MNERQLDIGPGFARAKECPDCNHTRCSDDCVCNCDAARAEHEASTLREQLAAEREKVRTLTEDVTRARHIANELTLETQTVEDWTVDLARQVREARASLDKLFAVTRSKCDIHHGARMECGQCYDSQAQHLKNALASRRALAMRVAERVNQANGTLGPEGLKFAVAEVEASHG